MNQDSGPSTSSVNNGSGSTSSSQSASSSALIIIEQPWMYISRPELATWIGGWKCVNTDCRSDNARVFEGNFYLFKCGHRVCEECKSLASSSDDPECFSCDMAHTKSEMENLIDASYINEYRDQLKQHGIPCTICSKNTPGEIRYYPRELMYVCTNGACSNERLDKDTVYDIYSDIEQVYIKDERVGAVKRCVGKLTRVCLYCKSKGEHFFVDREINDSGHDSSKKEEENYDHILDDCELEPIGVVGGLKATMIANHDKTPHTSVRTPWHLQMLNEKFMLQLSKDMLSCYSCKGTFKSDLHHHSMRQTNYRVVCSTCSSRNASGQNVLNNSNGDGVFPSLYELSFTKTRDLYPNLPSSNCFFYRKCYKCLRVHSIDYLRRCKDQREKNDSGDYITVACCLKCFISDSRTERLARRPMNSSEDSIE